MIAILNTLAGMVIWSGCAVLWSSNLYRAVRRHEPRKELIICGGFLILSIIGTVLSAAVLAAAAIGG